MLEKIYKTIKILRSLPIFWVVIFGILAARTLLFEKGYFMMHDDLQMMRQLEMEKCLLDGQIPCRWVPDMGFGYGFPLFNFYPPLPYFIGQFIRVFGFSFVDTVKINFAFGIILSGITMYFLSKEFFGKYGAFLSSVFYMWAPYHAVDIFVRGALNESWALTWFPAILYVTYKLIREDGKTKWLLLLSLSWFALLTTHNLMVLIFTPLFALWILILMLTYKNIKVILHILLSGIWALGLAAFFTLPAMFENNLTHLKSQLQGYFEYSAHFVTLKQLFLSNYWGYGGSAWGTDNDGMSFQVGKIYWIASIFIFILIGIKLIYTLKRDRESGFLNTLRKHPVMLITLYMVIFGWINIFMTHSRSTFLYLALPFLQFVQFPWRFLTLVIFTFSFSVGAIPGAFNQLKKIKIPVVSIIANFVSNLSQLFLVIIASILLILFNWNYFKPYGGKMGPLTDKEKFSGVAWELQQGGGVMDYLPETVEAAPITPRENVFDILVGQSNIIDTKQGTFWYLATIDSETKSLVRLNSFDFPNWRVQIDNENIPHSIPRDEKLGRIYFEVPEGKHVVYIQFYNTWIRTAANFLSLISWFILILYLFRKFFRDSFLQF